MARSDGSLNRSGGVVPRTPGLPSDNSSRPSGEIFENLAAFDVIDDAGVDDPDVAVGVELDSVRKDELPGAEAANQLAGRIELQDRIDGGLGAGIDAASLEHPDVALASTLIALVEPIVRPGGIVTMS